MATFPINNTMFMSPKQTPESAWLGHIPFAGWLVEEARPNILVELGTHRGASYLAFCQAVQQCAAQTKCYAVDSWEGDEHAGEYGEDVFLKLLDYHQRNYADFSRLMKMRFEEAVEYFDDDSVDLLHIDGLHTYEAVRNDFETWLPKLSGRAVVLFHDINVRERGFGVWRYWAEVSRRFPAFEFIHTHGLGVLLVGDEQPEPLRWLCEMRSFPESAVLINRFFDNLGRLITSSIDIGTLAKEQGRLAGLLNDANNACAALRSELDSQGTAYLAQLHSQQAAYQAEVDRNNHLSASVKEAEEKLPQLKDQLQSERLRHDDVLKAIESLRGKVEDMSDVIGSKDRDIEHLAEQLHRVTEEVLERRLDLERMRRSLSWRFTSPFRAIRRLI